MFKILSKSFSNLILLFQKLVGFFKEALKTSEGLEEFRHISQKFREGVYKTDAYYDHCQAALKDKFDKVFPELLVLLPDIGKQQVNTSINLSIYLFNF